MDKQTVHELVKKGWDTPVYEAKLFWGIEKGFKAVTLRREKGTVGKRIVGELTPNGTVQGAGQILFEPKQERL